MSAPNSTSADAKLNAAEPSGPKRESTEERRKRRRAKITAKLLIRSVNTPEQFEEVCTSVDVSRDGVLFVSKYAGYWKGQRVSVTFPYEVNPSGMDQGRPATIVRVQEQPENKFAVAVHFPTAITNAKNGQKSESIYFSPLTKEPGQAPPVAGGADESAVSATVLVTSHKLKSVILAVEPDIECADTIRRLFAKDGYTVIVVSTEKEALVIMRTTVPVAFLTHERRVPTSEEDICVAIKKIMRLRDVPIILFTQDAKTEDRPAPRHQGAVMRLATPVKPERLQQVVHLVAPPPLAINAYGTRVVGTIERTF